MVVYQKIRTNSKGAPCVLGESIPPNTEAWWDTEKQGFVCRMHYEATIAPPEPKAEPSSQASAPQGAHTVEGGGSAAAETPNPGTGQGPGGAPEAVPPLAGLVSKMAPDAQGGYRLANEGVIETIRFKNKGAKGNEVTVTRTTDYGRLVIRAKVQQWPGETLPEQLNRARNQVWVAFEEERKR